MEEDISKDKWNDEFDRELKEGRFPKWPNEVMVKSLFGDYFTFPKPSPSWKVLDIGCAFGSNLLPFADLGCEIFGIDIHQDIAKKAERVMHSRGYINSHFKEGSNRAIPYSDNTFDLILSINTIHYESNEEKINFALNEFSRILKPGGLVYISTVGPEHAIYQRAVIVNSHEFIIKDFGFRTGERFFFMDNLKYLKRYLDNVFVNAQVGEVKELFPSLPLHFLIGIAQKKF